MITAAAAGYAAIGFAAAAAMSLSAAPAVIRLGILDRPNSRKIHEKPIPKAGGIGIFLPVILLEIIACFLFKNFPALPGQFGMMLPAATFLLMAAGVVDDRIELRSGQKLLIQLAVAVATVMSGIGFTVVGIAAVDAAVSVLWITGIINAVNLIDGLDGLAAGIAVISGVGFLSVGLITGDTAAAFTAAAIAGSCSGFLRYNFRPARIFMGDAGSLPLGYSLAVLGILSANSAGGRSAVIIPVIMLGVPIYDTLLAIVRRTINHRPVFEADRSHFYNLIMDVKGVGHRNTVLVIYAVNIFLLALSIMSVYFSTAGKAVLVCLLAASAVLLSCRLGFIRISR